MDHSARKPILAANWKMHKTAAETRSFFDVFLPLVEAVSAVELLIAPPFTAIQAASKKIQGINNVSLCAQNMYHEEHGAFTGEISPAMLREFGVRYVIIGHSERRHIFGESGNLLSRKVHFALENRLTPVYCIGEKLDEREAGQTFEVLDRQLSEGLGDITAGQASGAVLAYEPVWAIGTGRTATPAQAQEAHSFIRGWLEKHFGSAIADQIRILYGGSANPGNIKELVALPDVDGCLVGGASLRPESFSEMAVCIR